MLTKLTDLKKSINSLEELLSTEQSFTAPHYQIAVIEKFSLCLNLAWNLVSIFVYSSNPIKGAIETTAYLAEEEGLLNNRELWLTMLIDKRDMNHTYNSELANNLFHKIKVFLPELKFAYEGLQSKCRAEDA